MPRYKYKDYINRAFWNSLFATLSALVLVLIILYGWQLVVSIADNLPFSIGEGDNEALEDEEILNQLEALKSSEEVSEVEQDAILQNLSAGQDDMTEGEKLELLDKLKGDETP